MAAAAAAQPATSEPGAPQAAQPPHVLIRNGAREPCEQRSGPWLAAAPRGAYTTARTVGRGELVFKLTSHITRLASSANLMAEADARASDHMAAELPLFHADALRPLACQAMRDAVQALQQQMGSKEQEVKLTLLLTWGADGRPDLACHAEPLPPRPEPPVRLIVKGLPRVNAKAKDSEWVRQRRELEAAKPTDCNEVLLVSPDGCVLEGLTSNFFVLSAGGELLTADEGVLSGTVRELILEVCREQGIPVRLQPPQLADVDSWAGAFISSTSRLLLPACEVGYTAADGQQRAKVFGSQHPTVALLEAQVAAKVRAESEPIT